MVKRNGQLVVSSPKTKTVNKFARAISGIQTTATDVWDRADATPTQQIWVAPTQARIHTIVSTSDVDSGPGGTKAEGLGAKVVRVFGLASWATKEVYEDVVSDGTVGVNTTGAYVIIHRTSVIDWGSSGPNVGVITATAATDGSVTAQINVGEGQTQMCIYGIPSNQILMINNYYATINKQSASASTVNFSLLLNQRPDSELTSFLTKNTRGLQSNGTSSDTWTYDPPYEISGPAIIKIQGIASAADVEASAGFNSELKDM
jgi:hypothetical protein